MQIAILGKRRQRLFRLLSFRLSEHIKVDAHGGRHLDLADADPVGGIPGQYVLLIFEHHGRVADVVTDTQVPLHLRLTADRPQHLLKEPHDIVAALQHAPRLRLQADIDQASRLGFQARESLDHLIEILRGQHHLLATRGGMSPRHGQRGNTAFQSGWQQRIESRNQIQCVLRTVVLPPRRAVHAVLDDSARESRPAGNRSA